MQVCLEALRLLLGLFVILFAPGYSLQAALFPRAADLGAEERLGLSFVLSVAISSPMIWILDKFPGGLGAGPVAISFVGFTLTSTLIAVYRRRHLPESQRLAINFLTCQTHGPATQLSSKGPLAMAQAGRAAATRTRWRREPRGDKRRPWARRYWAVGLALGIALAGAVVMTSIPAPRQGYSEFYLLGMHRSAEDYPREATAGQPLEVVFGITDREGEGGVYRVDVYQDEAKIGVAGPYRLGDGEMLEAGVTFTPLRAGEDVRVRFYLFKDGSAQPYRSLELWMRVKAQD